MNLKKIKEIYGIIADVMLKFTADSVSAYAAQAALFIIIAVIPFIMLLLNILHVFLPISPDYIDNIILTVMPTSMQSLLLSITDELFSKSSSVPIISVTAVSTLWLASRGVMALYQGISAVFHADTRNYFYCRAMSIIYTLIFILIIVLVALVFTFGNTLRDTLAVYIPWLSNIFAFIMRFRILIFTVFLSVIFALFYRYLPRKKPMLRFLHQLPGAFGAAVGWLIFSYLYSLYIENFSNYSYVYGSITAVIFFMLWLYICMYIFLLGAQLNKLLDKKYYRDVIEKFKAVGKNNPRP